MSDFLTPLTDSTDFTVKDDEFTPADVIGFEGETADEPETLDAEGEVPEKHSRRKSGPRAVKVTPAIVRRVLDLATRLDERGQKSRGLLAATLGVRNDTTELTVAVMTAGRTALTPVDELLALADEAKASPFQAMVTAMAMDRNVSLRVWAILGALDTAAGTLPAKPEQAAAKVAESALQLSGADREALAGIRNLLS